MLTQDWACATTVPPIAPGEVHVWRFQRERDPKRLIQSTHLLTTREQARALRFRNSADREQFTSTRSRLRLLASVYLGIAPAEFQLREGTYGKPEFNPNGLQLHFNVSHTRELALIAFARNAEIGVDIESLRRETEHIELATTYFAPSEVAYLRSSPRKEVALNFFRCWTRKEAFVKATGLGLSMPLDSFEVSLETDVDIQIRSAAGVPLRDRLWTLLHLQPGMAHVGAIAVEGTGWNLSTFSLDSEAETEMATLGRSLQVAVL